MFCGHCGSKMEEGQKFCSNCGKPVYSAFSDHNKKGFEAYSENESNNKINPVFDNKTNDYAPKPIDEVKDHLNNGFAALKENALKLWNIKTGRIICLSFIVSQGENYQ